MADVDSAAGCTTDHNKAVVLLLSRLEGQARAETNENDLIAPGCSDALGNIAFNAELLAASNEVAIDDQFKVLDDDEILADINGAAYVALLEQTITHEMAQHIKHHHHHHHEGWSGPGGATDKKFQKDTPVKSPLYGESDVAIETNIRNTYFPAADDPPMILTAKTHNQGIKNIAHRTARNNPFRTPLYLQLQEYRSSEHRSGGPLTNFSPRTNLTLEQIWEYMDFPKEGDECVKDDDRKARRRALFPLPEQAFSIPIDGLPRLHGHNLSISSKGLSSRPTYGPSITHKWCSRSSISVGRVFHVGRR